MIKILSLLFLVALVAADIAPLLNADSPTVIPGSYIIVLKDGLTKEHRDAHINRLKYNISFHGADAQVTFTYDVILGFAARLDDALLKVELADPEVQYIEADQVMSINTPVEEPEQPFEVITQTGATWGLVRIGQRDLALSPANYAYDSTAGANVDVYVIDTGILATHTDFGGRVTTAFTAITGEANTDLNGHGTHCAGTIGGATYGVAKKVNLFAVKVLSASGSGSTAGVISGVDYVAKNKRQFPSVASMSLGGGASATLDSAITNAITVGIVFVVAAGNDNANACNYSPARVGQAITVGATTNTDARASYSNFGTCVSLFAPGSSITSDWIGSSNSAINTISGTSMATPHVAGAIAAHFGFNTFTTPAAAKTWAINTATPAKVTNPGTGSPNLLLYSPSTSN